MDFHVSPTCAPTRSAIFSGRHEFKNGVTHTILERERLTLNSVTLAETLRDAGYSTGIFGKWHLGDETEYLPSARGFTEMFIHGAGGIGQSYPGSCGDAPGNQYFDPAIYHNGKFVKTEGYCTDVFFQQASGWIKSQNEAGKPFFAYIATNATIATIATIATNLADDPQHAAKLAEMRALLLAQMRRLDDPWRFSDQPDDGMTPPKAGKKKPKQR